LFGDIQRNGMPKGRVERSLAYDIGTRDLWEIWGGENVVSQRAKLLAVQSVSLPRDQFSKHRTYLYHWLRELEPETFVCGIFQTVKGHGLQWTAKTRHEPFASTQPQSNLAALRKRRC